MNPDLYGTWLETGDNLQPIGDWLAGNAWWLVTAAFAVLAVRGWIEAAGDDYRTRNDQVAAQRITRFEPRPEAPEPGHNDYDLLVCLQILDATNARKERP